MTDTIVYSKASRRTSRLGAGSAGGRQASREDSMGTGALKRGVETDQSQHYGQHDDVL